MYRYTTTVNINGYYLLCGMTHYAYKNIPHSVMSYATGKTKC